MLVPLSKLKEVLKIPVADTSSDAFLLQWGTIISNAVEIFCRRKLLAADYIETQYYDDDGVLNDSLMLYQYPLNSVTSITPEGQDPLDLSTMRLQKSVGVVFCKHGFYRNGADSIEIKYNAGFVTLPPVIEMVVTSLVQEKYNREKTGMDLNFGSDVQRISIPSTISIDFDYTLTNNDPNNEMGQILGNYMNVLTPFKSERAISPQGRVVYVD